MLHYTIHSFLHTELSNRTSNLSFSFDSSNENIEFHWYLTGGFIPFCSSLTTPLKTALIFLRWLLDNAIKANPVKYYFVYSVGINPKISVGQNSFEKWSLEKLLDIINVR